jgi:hypothetical protein
MEEINQRITLEVCHDALDRLTDTNLLEEYKDCNSVKKRITKLSSLLEKYGIDDVIKNKIIEEYTIDLVPPGTKGVIRGNKFNNIVKEYIENLSLNPEVYEVCFEKNHLTHTTSEIPDWYILHKETNKILIGMNQLDLWGGGHQTNRGSKYLLNNTMNSENCRILCVVCNQIQFKGKNNKTYKLFEVGFENNTLCYLKNLQNIIYLYFQM